MVKLREAVFHVRNGGDCLNKIDMMYKLFGRNHTCMCCDCVHFRRKSWNGRSYRKCAVYGDSQSEGTDWRATYPACGLAPDREYTGDCDVIDLVRRQKIKKEAVNVEGQISMF